MRAIHSNHEWITHIAKSDSLFKMSNFEQKSKEQMSKFQTLPGAKEPEPK